VFVLVAVVVIVDVSVLGNISYCCCVEVLVSTAGIISKSFWSCCFVILITEEKFASFFIN